MMTNTPHKSNSVKNDLELLLRLQVIDYELGELERSKEYLPDMMNTLKGEMEEVARKLQETRSSLEQLKVNQKNLELEIEGKQAELQKYQQQMMTIKTNREYDALVAEIDSVKEAISTAETTLLETMDQITALEEQVVELEQKHEQVQQNNNRQLEVLQQKMDSIDGKVAAKQAERQEIVATIPRRTLSVYDRVRRGRGGRAVVPVRKRACGACFKALTPKKIQEIKRGDSIHTCEACGCLLYWDENESN